MEGPRRGDGRTKPAVDSDRIMPLFDEQWYVSTGPSFEGNALEHFVSSGWRQGRSPHPLFDVPFYISQLEGSLPIGVDPLTHYCENGAEEGLDPHPLFLTSDYLAAYGDVVGSANPLAHYLVEGGFAGFEPHPFFSSSHYLSENAEVREAAISPLVHYVMFGASQGRSPHPFFDGQNYSRRWGLRDDDNPLRHFAERLRRSSYHVASSAPRCSIVILNWNRAHMTVQCIIDAMETRGIDFEIVVVDNGSRPEEFAALTKLSPASARIVRLSENRYFGEGNNIGVEASSGEYVLLLNNDAFIGPDTVSLLVDTLDRYPDAGIVGPKFIYPDGRIQEAGGLVSGCGTVTQRGKFLEDSADYYGRTEVVDYVSAACLLIRRSLFDRLGGFDLTWDPAYYEDVDLCLKALLGGKKTYYCGGVSVTHIENGTSSDPSHGLRLNNIVALNREKFIARWGAYLDGDHDSTAVRTALPAQLSTYGSSLSGLALLYTPYPLVPGGGERYLLTMAEILSSRCRTVLLTPERYSSHRLRTMGQELGLDLSCVELRTTENLVELAQADVLIAMGNEALPPIAPFARENIFVCQFPFPMHPNHVANSWGRLDGYDTIVAYSEFAAFHVRGRLRRYARRLPPVRVLAPPVPNYFSSLPPPRIAGRIVNVGRFTPHGHCKRQDTLVQAFCKLVDSTNRDDLELHLVGTVGADPDSREFLLDVRKLAKQYPVYFHLSAAPQTVAHLYQTAALYWHATGFGASARHMPERMEHFGISVLEAMSAGAIPLVYHEGGPADLVQDTVTGFHWDSTDTLSARSARALDLPEVISESMRAAARAQARRFDSASFESEFLRLLNEGAKSRSSIAFAFNS